MRVNLPKSRKVRLSLESRQDADVIFFVLSCASCRATTLDSSFAAELNLTGQ